MSEKGGFALGSRSDGTPFSLEVSRISSHSFVAGMTGSGKTGLLAIFAEEALALGIPVIVLDAKGDLASLGSLRGFDVRIYTPGSGAGTPVSIARLFSLPRDDDAEREALEAAATILSLTGGRVSSEDVQLLAAQLLYAWSRRYEVDLGLIARMLLYPPARSIGGIDADSLVSAARRRELAVKLVGSLSRMESWISGEELKIDKLVRKSAAHVFLLNHLSSPERMMFTSFLLREVRRWMLKQSPSDSLRLLILLDEVRGFIPPHPDNPPSKEPLLSIVKQGRGFGVSIVLATQNPVDVDYKALGNARLWFVGRLQTRNDVDRVVAGIAEASGASAKRYRSVIMSLKQREFLLYDAWSREAIVFITRDCAAVRSKPLQLQGFTAMQQPTATSPTRAFLELPPQPPEGCSQLFGSVDEEKLSQWLRYKPLLYYRPYLLVVGTAKYSRRSAAITEREVYAAAALFEKGRLSFRREIAPGMSAELLLSAARPIPDVRFRFEPLTAELGGFHTIAREFRLYASSTASLKLYSCPATGDLSEAGESLEDFAARQVRKLASKVEAQLSKTLEELEKAEAELEAIKLDVLAESVGALLGRRSKRKISSGVARLSRMEAKVRRLRVRREELLAQLERVRNPPIKIVEAKPVSINISFAALTWIPVAEAAHQVIPLTEVK